MSQQGHRRWNYGRKERRPPRLAANRSDQIRKRWPPPQKAKHYRLNEGAGAADATRDARSVGRVACWSQEGSCEPSQTSNAGGTPAAQLTTVQHYAVTLRPAGSSTTSSRMHRERANTTGGTLLSRFKLVVDRVRRKRQRLRSNGSIGSDAAEDLHPSFEQPAPRHSR